jgi:regulator of cell morphogenesis and NO signaling
MTDTTQTVSLRGRSVGDIAASVPGATEIFRKFRIDFCCNGDLDLEAAAQKRGADAAALRQALESLAVQSADSPARMGSDELIDHIESCYHQAHRQQLPELIALSRKVEAVHRDHPKVPAGLADVLRHMAADLEEHMAREEASLFPAMRASDAGDLGLSIAELRAGHDRHGQLVELLETITGDFAAPEGACRSWRALYIGTARLVDDLMEHIHLENNVLFPRFAASPGASV